MAAATDVGGIIFDTATAYFEENGSATGGTILGVLGSEISVVTAALGNDPALEVTAVTVGLFAVAALGPTATVATAIETAALAMTPFLAEVSPSLVSLANPIAEALINGFIAGGAANLYTNLNSAINSIVTNLGGSMTSVSSSVSNGLLASASSSSNPNVIVASAPDSSGNIGQLLISLPTPSQDSESVAVVTQGTSVVTPGAPAYLTDEYTGSTITFIGNDDEEHTATVYYLNAAGTAYVVDPASGYLAVGTSSVTSITAPSGDSSQLLGTQFTNNSDGSQTSQEFGSNGDVQYTQSTNTTSSGDITATISGDGDATGLSNASITLSNDALATIIGSYNGVTIGLNVNLAVGGSNNTVDQSGTPTSSTGSTVTVDGPEEQVSLSYTTVEVASGGSATLTGDNNTVSAGSDATLTINSSSSSNGTTVTGAGTSVTDNGSDDTVTLNSSASSDTTAVTGSGTTVTDNGSGDTLNLNSGATDITATANGSGDLINLNGTDQAATVNGTDGGGIGYGSDDTITLGSAASGSNIGTYGTASVGYLDGTDENDYVLGTYSGGIAYGEGDDVVLDSGATGSNAGTYGSGDLSDLYGANQNAYVLGTGSGGYAYAANDTVDLDSTATGSNGGTYGSDDSVNLEGNDQNAYILASAGTANVYSTNDGAYLDANGDSAFMGSSGTTGSFLTGTSVQSGETVDITVTQGSGGTITFTDDASGSGSNDYDLSGSNELTGVSTSSLVTDGNYMFSNANLSAGGSIANLFNPVNSIIETAAYYTGANDTGELSSAGVALAPYTVDGESVSGVSVYDYFSYNGSGDETGYTEDWYAGSDLEGYANFSATGTFISGDDEFADDGGYGDGSEFELAPSTSAGTTSPSTTGTNFLAQFASTLPGGNAIAAQDAQTAGEEINLITLAPATGADSADQALYEGAKWNGNVITWSLADMAADSPFSSYIASGSQYEALIQQAFNVWGAASGLTFEEVPDASQSDITIGFGDFGTSSSGVVGYTTYAYDNSQLQPGTTIRLEDPSQDSLVAGTNSTLTYTGTQASLYQVILHEIGHALGLADNNDPSSVMYYEAGPNNTTFDSSDVQGVQELYGSEQPSQLEQSTLQTAGSLVSGASVGSMLQQLIQANASFLTPSASSSLSSAPLATTMIAPTLVASSALH